MFLIAGSVERRENDAEQWLRDAASKAPQPVETHPVGVENDPHTITTNLTFNLMSHLQNSKISQR
jgi:hypothetical protein